MIFDLNGRIGIVWSINIHNHNCKLIPSLSKVCGKTPVLLRDFWFPLSLEKRHKSQGTDRASHFTSAVKNATMAWFKEFQIDTPATFLWTYMKILFLRNAYPDKANLLHRNNFEGTFFFEKYYAPSSHPNIKRSFCLNSHIKRVSILTERGTAIFETKVFIGTQIM